MKTAKKIIISILVVILAVILVALGVFQGEARTLLSVKENGDTVDYDNPYVYKVK